MGLLVLLQVSRPRRVSLADRNEWSTNTIGFGPECKSNTWRMKSETDRDREKEREKEREREREKREKKRKRKREREKERQRGGRGQELL